MIEAEVIRSQHIASSIISRLSHSDSPNQIDYVGWRSITKDAPKARRENKHHSVMPESESRLDAVILRLIALIYKRYIQFIYSQLFSLSYFPFAIRFPLSSLTSHGCVVLLTSTLDVLLFMTINLSTFLLTSQFTIMRYLTLNLINFFQNEDPQAQESSEPSPSMSN